MRMKAFSWLRATGVAAALAEAAYLALEKLASPSADITWISLTLLGPVLLAIGNLYRSLRWPSGVSAEALAPGMLCAATLLLMGVSFLPGFDLSVPSTTTAPLLLICGQAIVFAVHFSLLFMLGGLKSEAQHPPRKVCTWIRRRSTASFSPRTG